MHGVQRRFEEGRATIIDVNQAKADLAAARSQAVGAAGALDLALAQLGELAGRPVGRLAAFAPHLPLADFSPQALGGWLARAEDNDFDIQLQAIALESATRGIAKATSEFLPTAELVGNYSTGKSIFAPGLEVNNTQMQQRSNSVGIVVSVPLLNGMASTGRVSQARHLARQAHAELSRVRQAARFATTRAFLSSRTSFEQIAAGQAAVSSAQFALDAVNKGYAYGKKSMTDIGLAADRLFQATRDQARFQYDFYIHYLTLLSSTGTLDASRRAVVLGRGVCRVK